MVLGFCLAAYAVVANDSIQTLGTFIASNSHRPWWLMWAFASSILVGVLLFGWYQNAGDPAYGRLEKFPLPTGGVTILHVMAPLVLLFLTRYGIPVSTTFLVLSVFAPSNIESMLAKSLVGYGVAFAVGFAVYKLVIGRLSEHFHNTRHHAISRHWVLLQWLATGFLWSQWLIQDLANIFVFVPRQLDLGWLLLALLILVSMQGLIFYQVGGRIQQIVTSKTMTTDVRAATILDFIYGLILLVFKEWSNMPMSTTWVFIGLLAGRELAMTLQFNRERVTNAWRAVGSDASKAFAGLVVSVALAFGAVAANV